MKTNNISRIFALTIGVMTLSTSFAQTTKGFHHGLRLGIGESIVHLDNETTEDTKLMLTGGLSTNYQFNRFIGLSADFLVSGKGGVYKGSEVVKTTFGDQKYSYMDKYKISYVEIPLMLKLSIPLGDEFALRAYTGPSANFLFGGFETREYDDANYQEDNGYQNREMKNLKVADGGWVFGGGVDVITGNGSCFVLDLRAMYGTRPAGVVNGFSATNQSYMISFAFLLD